MVKYKVNGKIDARELDPFFQGWKSPPSLDIRRKLLKGSDLVITARDKDELVGFLTAISDRALVAFISLVEVLESCQGRGIGKRMMELAVAHFKGYYQIILTTDFDKRAFYEKVGFKDLCGMQIQNFAYTKCAGKRRSKK